jgi:squalene synthase HpnC
LEDFRKSLIGDSDAVAEGVKLRAIIRERKLSPQHALDLLEAFRRDVTKLRYKDWDDLIDYCRYSAMPVGRYVLDVHGETHDAWPLNDALCAALQVINHLQDCSKDFKALNRVYIPEDEMRKAGMRVEELGKDKASPALRKVITSLAARNGKLLAKSKAFAGAIADTRLGLEVSVIQTFAEDLNAMLSRRDPLSEKVHHGKGDMAVLGFAASLRFAGQRLWRKSSRKEAA